LKESKKLSRVSTTLTKLKTSNQPHIKQGDNLILFNDRSVNLNVIVLLTIYFLSPALWAKDIKNSPNIILIVADYMGYADIEPYGSKDIKTPSLNNLAFSGKKFTNHYSSAPSCIPSRASLLSGMYPHKVLEPFKNTRGRGLSAKNNTLLKGLKSQNYRTALIGKWHLGSEKNFSPNDHGFDYFYGFDSWTLGYHNHLTSDGFPGLYRNNELINEAGYLTDLFTKEASQFIQKNHESPFFLYLSYNAGLPPYQTPDMPKSQWHMGWDAEHASRSDYVAMIERMDLGIGKILDTLNALSLSENTLVIFTYDHGGRNLVNSGELFHGFGTLWEGGIRVPLIMRWPNKINRNTTLNSPSIAMDITATLLETVSADNVIAKTDGQNLLANSSLVNTVDREINWRSRNMKAIRKGNWKYINDNHSHMLFNLSKDVSERNNLFYKNKTIANELKSKIENWE